MSCEECKYSPKTYEEYCIRQSNPSMFCPDAYTEKAHLCNNYHAKKLAKWDEKESERKESEEV